MFNEYVVGKPNRLRIPLRFKFHKDLIAHKDVSAPKVLTKELSVFCYNDEYPRMIEIDTDILVKFNRIRLGEIVGTLPPGIELDRKVHPNLN